MSGRRLSNSARNLMLAGAVLYAIMPAAVNRIGGVVTANPGEAESQRTARNSSAFAVMLGEFRTSLSDLLFIKTERYLDRGVGYEPHVNTREMASAEGAKTEKRAHADKSEADHDHDHAHEADHDHAHDHDHDHPHEDVHDHDHEHAHADEASAKTLIRNASEDFRGFIGSLERQVKPWRPPGSPHNHASGSAMSEVLPWYRLATISNPHDVRNYYIGAWWLKSLRNDKQRQEAIRFLNEGIGANPGAYELYLMRGMVYKDMAKMTDARDSFRKSAHLGLKRRPPGGYEAGKDQNWDVTNEEQLDTAIGMDVMLTRDLETTASAKQVLSGYQKALPDEPSLGRMENVLNGN